MRISPCMDTTSRALLFLTIALLHTHIATTAKLFSVEIPQINPLPQGEAVKIGEFLASPSGKYKLHFFTLSDDESDDYYLGIAWRDECVWLANRNQPFSMKADPTLMIDDYGNMKVSFKGDSNNSLLIYSSQRTSNINVSATLTDWGSFELAEMNEYGYVIEKLWSSFDYPNNILLPDMTIGFNKVTGKIWNITSWAASKNPVLGSFTLGIDVGFNNTIQLVIRWRENVYWSSGAMMIWAYSYEGGVITYYFENLDKSIHFWNNSDENQTSLLCSTWDDGRVGIGLSPQGDLYGLASVSCNTNNPTFVKGCVPPKPPNCRHPDVFVSMLDNQYGNMSNEGYTIEGYENLPLYDCGVMCLMNCSCQAYSSTNNDGTGCQMWDRRANFVGSPDGQKIYFIQDDSKVNSQIGKFMKNHQKLLISSLTGGALLVLILSYLCLLLRRRHRIQAERRLNQEKILDEFGDIAIPFTMKSEGSGSEKTSHAIHIFSLESVVMATDNFSSRNKLGEGGFGPVYKGKLINGQEIAVKRLSRSSGQGLVEFKNEVKLIAKLQHTNLVRLCGFCFEGEEIILIYEYMLNKSLDFYIFDFNNRIFLNWKRRLNIIYGIAQGLAYLHIYSRLKVIHRDLKPSNILLDYEWNPKISDFGMARIFGLKESEERTNRVVGTHGYMSPEYMLNGTVSTKIDVFSFGVLLLEIISGKKNTSYINYEESLSLLGLAWQLWNEGRALQLVDPILSETCTMDEIKRCIHIGLLCVQGQAKDRPTILEVVSFLSNETILLEEPKQPAFFFNIVVKKTTQLDNNEEKYSINDVTISDIDGR